MRLGKGTFGTVDRVRRGKRLFAKKIIRDDEKNVDIPACVVREVGVLRAFPHPHIVRLDDVTLGKHHASLYFDLYQQSLFDFLIYERQRQVRCDVAVSVLQVGLQVLEYLHEHGVLHRDLKPSNILLDRNYTPVVADLGSARPVDGTGQAITGGMCTALYCAPETCASDKEADFSPMCYGPKSDIYSLGVTVVQTMLGEEWSNERITDAYLQVKWERYMRKYYPHLSVVCHLVSSMLVMDPALRPLATAAREVLHFPKNLPTPTNIPAASHYYTHSPLDKDAREKCVGWIVDITAKLQPTCDMCLLSVHTVHLLDDTLCLPEFHTLNEAQILCAAAAALVLVTKYFYSNVKLLADLLTTTHQVFSLDDLCDFERTIFLMMGGHVLRRQVPVAAIQKTAPMLKTCLGNLFDLTSATPPTTVTSTSTTVMVK